MHQKTIDEQLARIEELERTVQYLIDCPFNMEETVKRKEFASQMLDRKPSESLRVAGKEEVGKCK